MNQSSNESNDFNKDYALQNMQCSLQKCHFVLQTTVRNINFCYTTHLHLLTNENFREASTGVL